MSPTKRKKPEKQPKRPSVAKRGRAAAPAAEEAQAAPESEEFATVDLADGALYSGSELSTEDVSQEEDRLGEDPLAARDKADGLLPRNTVSAVMGAAAKGQRATARNDAPTGEGVNGGFAGASAADSFSEDGVAAAHADDSGAGAAAVETATTPAEVPAAGPTEVTDEERAAFYSAVPTQRPEEPEGKGSKRPKRKGKVASAKTPGGKRGNPRADAAGQGAAAKSAGAAAPKAKKAAGRKVSVGFVVKVVIVALLVLAVALAIVAVVAFNQVRNGGDDAQDFQGTWYLNGTNVPVQITADEIVLTSDVAYDYQLDTADKTLQLEFGNLKGGGSYLFSLNRQQLMIVDGETSSEELLPDFFWTMRALLAQLRGEEYPLPEMENATYLNRAPAPGQAVTDATAANNNLLAGGEGADNGSGADAAGSGDSKPNDGE